MLMYKFEEVVKDIIFYSKDNLLHITFLSSWRPNSLLRTIQ